MQRKSPAEAAKELEPLLDTDTETFVIKLFRTIIFGECVHVFLYVCVCMCALCVLYVRVSLSLSLSLSSHHLVKLVCV